MKNLSILLSFLFLIATNGFAQNTSDVLQNDLPLIKISKDLTIHFISPENIQYVDISTHAIAGDLPVKNILRIKVLPDLIQQLLQSGNKAVLTVVGESYIAQYRLDYVPESWGTHLPAQVEISPDHMNLLDFPGITLTTNDLQALSLKILKQQNPPGIRSVKGAGVKAILNQVYAVGNYVFLDISYFNQTNLPYEIDEQRFKIEDKRITKATNSQSIEIKPIWKLYSSGSFKKQYRNIYVLKKLTFPGNKVLNIELNEKQLSGRTLSMRVQYRDILNADTL